MNNVDRNGSSTPNGSTNRPKKADSIFAEASMVTINESSQHEAVSDVLKRLTPQARRALDAARDEARKEGATSVCTHHVLLAMLREPECGACKILDEVGIDYDEARRRIAFISGCPASPTVPSNRHDLEFSPRLSLALDAAGHEAERRGQTEVGTVHLLIAMLRVREGLVVAVLETPGLGLEPVGSAVVRAFRADQAFDH